MFIVVTSKPGKELLAAREVLDFIIPWDPGSRIVSVGEWSGVALLETGLNFEKCVSLLRSRRRYVAIRSIPLMLVVPAEHEALVRGLRSVVERFRPVRLYLSVAKRGEVGGQAVFRAALEAFCTVPSSKNGELIVVVEGLGGRMGIAPLRKIEYFRLTGRRRLPARFIDSRICERLLSL